MSLLGEATGVPTPEETGAHHGLRAGAFPQIKLFQKAACDELRSLGHHVFGQSAKICFPFLKQNIRGVLICQASAASRLRLFTDRPVVTMGVIVEVKHPKENLLREY